MSLFGLVILGVVLGAAGAEYLRAKKPELIENLENKAKCFANSLSSLKSNEDSKLKAEENTAAQLNDQVTENSEGNASQSDNSGN